MKKTVLITLGAVAAVIILAVIIFALLGRNDDEQEISSYQQCVDAGYRVQESFPERCVTPDGRTFTNPDAAQQQSGEAPDTTDTTDGQAPPVSDRNEQGENVDLSIYFSEEPESSEDFSHTVAVTRSTTRQDVGAFAVEQLIAGPTEQEQERGLYSPLQGKLSGPSNCEDSDFTLRVSEGTARLQFCRTVSSGGVGDDARIRSTVDDTLMKFSTVNDVIILDRDGNCFGDESGRNECLQ